VNGDVHGRPPHQAGPPPSHFDPAAGSVDHRRRSLEQLVEIPAAVPVPPSRPSPPPKRVRVVLAERKRARRVVRTLAEVEEQVGMGEMLVRRLIRNQFATSALLALFVVLTIGGLPLLFAFRPEFGQLSLFGFRLPWLVLGVLVYPFMLLIGWIYVRLADRNEQAFIHMVED
jgi:uncharacterized membrane protein (DUF485 family)